ncbi:hypothetical protein CEXT_705291 [Caerostris extrusa]|uniref:Uncharacterized protein n=1 Tax=Caerostris extrusa TaxID=172846 RepID=A0AAV4WEH5_CAEEX|nr:hypothetical protein CEXT_705291 [Caerostris extrusa]
MLSAPFADKRTGDESSVPALFEGLLCHPYQSFGRKRSLTPQIASLRIIKKKRGKCLNKFGRHCLSSSFDNRRREQWRARSSSSIIICILFSAA